MAHELEMVGNEGQMFFMGETPWHGLGTKLEKAPTSREAIVAAGLDWKVGTKKLVTADESRDVSRFAKATYRETDGKIFGVVGADWRPFQNAEAFGFFDPFVAAGQATYETAGSLRGGSRVWILAQIAGDPIRVVGDDVVSKYILLSNSHDGTLAIRVGFTPVRVVCANTLRASHEDGASQLIRITHTKNSNEAMERVRDVMDTVNRTFDATADDYRLLAKAGCNDADLKKYVNLVFAPKRVELATKAQIAEVGNADKTVDELVALSAEQLRSNVYPSIAKLFEGGRGSDMSGVRGSLWGAYNSISEYIVHERGDDPGKRLDSAWFGQGSAQNLRALKVGLALARAAA